MKLLQPQGLGKVNTMEVKVIVFVYFAAIS